MPHMRFPSFVLQSADDFRRFRDDNADLLDERYRREQALATREALVSRPGTCGPCLCPTQFSSATDSGDALSDGRRVPNWREQQLCGCVHRLNSRQRALLQFLLQRLGAREWFQAGLLGPRDGLAGYLEQHLGAVAIWPRAITGPDESMHLVASADQLHRSHNLDEVAADIARVLAPGGALVFTVPFDISREATRVTPSGADIGWDITDHLRAAGFSDALVHCYWSEELGYLGTFNFVFEAIR